MAPVEAKVIDIAPGLERQTALVVHAEADDPAQLRVDVELGQRSEINDVGQDAL